MGKAVVVDRDNAKKRDYTASADLTGTHTKEIGAISDRLGMSVGSLPDGAVKPAGGEYLIILGEDKK